MGRWIVLLALVGCDRAHGGEPLELASARGVTFDLHATAPPASYAPTELARRSIGKVVNADANIPPVCFTKSDGRSNPCWTCHTHSDYPNLADDWELQQNYPPQVTTNPWRNLFRDRSELVGGFADADVLAYVRTDNYSPLRASTLHDRTGYWPDVDFAAGFGADGFATDGSGWRAIRYKPFPGTFWPTNGSADDTYVRLPDEFRGSSREVYKTNLAILEAAIAGTPRDIEPIDERAGGVDVDGDGKLATATRIATLPATYAGTRVAVTARMYPQGTEMLHTVRYLDPDVPGFAARRMKEVRYMRKTAVLDEHRVITAYSAAENQPATGMAYAGDPITGVRNDLGWSLQGWIEDARGWLRLQTQEEHQFCMGCHTNIGVTVDQTFAFARKVPGAAGWRVQDPRGIPDVPQVGKTEPEYAQYLERVAGGDELRANGELASRYMKAGMLDREAVAAMRDDIAPLVLPSRARAIALDRAYLANVIEQSYVWGRDAIATPATNVNAKIDERSTGIGEADRTVRDGRLQLRW